MFDHYRIKANARKKIRLQSIIHLNYKLPNLIIIAFL